MAIGLEEKVREILFEKLKLNDKSIRLVKGWFNDTIPVHKKDVGKIALLQLDCDWYESVRLCLDELYDNVIEEGFIVIATMDVGEVVKRLLMNSLIREINK